MMTAGRRVSAMLKPVWIAAGEHGTLRYKVLESARDIRWTCGDGHDCITVQVIRVGECELLPAGSVIPATRFAAKAGHGARLCDVLPGVILEIGVVNHSPRDVVIKSALIYSTVDCSGSRIGVAQ